MVFFLFLHIKQIRKPRTVINTYIQQQQKQQRKEKNMPKNLIKMERIKYNINKMHITLPVV